jgi:hypothetical protein
MRPRSLTARIASLAVVDMGGSPADRAMMRAER